MPTRRARLGFLHFVYIYFSFACINAAAQNECAGDSGWQQAGVKAGTLIKDAVLKNCQNDPTINCVQKNKHAIDQVKGICDRCPSEEAKTFCLDAAEVAAEQALDALIVKADDRKRELEDEDKARRIAKEQENFEIDRKNRQAELNAGRPDCAPLCNAKDALPPYKKLPIDKAELKGLRIKMTEAEALKILGSKKMILNSDSKIPSKKIYVCGIKIKSPCDFSIAGERPFAAVLGFYDGILRQVRFVLTHPDEASGKLGQNSGAEAQSQFVMETYAKILSAFVEKFGMPIQDRPHAGDAPRATAEAAPEVKTYENKNVWAFGEDESIFINLHKAGLGNWFYQINVDFFDNNWQIEDKQNAEEEKTRKALEKQQIDLNKRKGDL